MDGHPSSWTLAYTTTPAGEMVASVMMSVAQWERKIIGQRTREALAIRRAQGAKLGRPRTLPEATRKRVVRMRQRGMTYRSIADELTSKQVQTAQGGAKWYPSTVRKIVATADW